MTFSIATAQRKNAKLKLNLTGPSGSGKTYSALLLASGMVPFERVGVLDTEHRRAEYYSDLGPFKHIPFEAPYSPERYIEAIRFVKALTSSSSTPCPTNTKAQAGSLRSWISFLRQRMGCAPGHA